MLDRGTSVPALDLRLPKMMDSCDRDSGVDDDQPLNLSAIDKALCQDEFLIGDACTPPKTPTTPTCTSFKKSMLKRYSKLHIYILYDPDEIKFMERNSPK